MGLRRRVIGRVLLLAALALCVGAPGSSFAAGSGTAATGLAAANSSAALSGCTAASASSGGSASFTAQMQAVTGTQTMEISFELYERTAGGSYSLSSAPGFGAWQQSKGGITDFTANQNVLDLPAGSAFRAVVHYRWIGRRRRIELRTSRVTKPCVIAALEPNLHIGAITHHPGTVAGTVVYAVTVRNAGALAAGAFNVAFSVGNVALPEQGLPGLAPDASAVVDFTGPRCSDGATLTAVADPENAVVEPADSRRSRSVVCGT